MPRAVYLNGTTEQALNAFQVLGAKYINTHFPNNRIVEHFSLDKIQCRHTFEEGSSRRVEFECPLSQRDELDTLVELIKETYDIEPSGRTWSEPERVVA